MHQIRDISSKFWIALGCAALAGCASEDDAGTGSLSVLLEPEGTIIDGIEAGDGAEDMRDGWSVAFERYIVTVGDIDVHSSTDPNVAAEAKQVFSVDLKQIDAAGAELWRLDGLREGRWEFDYSTPSARQDATRHDSVSKAEFEDMVDHGFTYVIEGAISNPDGRSCPPATLAAVGDRQPSGAPSGENDCYDAATVRFSFGAPAETRYGPCVIDDVPGFAVSAHQTQVVAVTIHGDHLFFNGFPEGSEGGVRRLAQWLADCDLDLDGTVTRAELEAIAPSDLPELDPERYQLGGAPLELKTMYDYVTAQLKTQGHFQGEGECPLGALSDP